MCAEALLGPRATTQVWCLWWPQNSIGGDDSDRRGGGGGDGGGGGEDTAPRPLGNLTDFMSAMTVRCA